MKMIEFKDKSLKNLVSSNPTEMDRQDVISSNKAYIAETLNIPFQEINDVNYNNYKTSLFNEEISDADVYVNFKQTENVDVDGWWSKNIIKPALRLGVKTLGTIAEGVGGTLQEPFVTEGVSNLAQLIFSMQENEKVDKRETYNRILDYAYEVEDIGIALSKKSEEFNQSTVGFDDAALAAADIAVRTPVYAYAATANTSLQLAGGLTDLVERIAQKFGTDSDEYNSKVSDAIFNFSAMLGENVPQEHNRLIEKYGGSESTFGAIVGITDRIAYSLANIKASVNQMQAIGLKLPFTSQSVNSTKLQEMYETFKRATLIGGYSFVSRAGDFKQRAKSAGVSFVYMSTRAFSGWFNKNYQTILSDLALNTAWTASPLWKEGGSGYEVWKSNELTTYQKLLWTAENSTADVYFSAMTRSFRNSSDYAKLSPEDKIMFEAVTTQVQKDIYNGIAKDPKGLDNFIINKQGGFDAFKESKETKIAIEEKMNELFNEANEGL